MKEKQQPTKQGGYQTLSKRMSNHVLNSNAVMELFF